MNSHHVSVRTVSRPAAPLVDAAPMRLEEAHVRTATTSDAGAIHSLIATYLTEGRLLARTLDNVSTQSHRFAVAVIDRQIVGCAELAPLSHEVAEIRSLVVHRDARSLGLGRRLVDELKQRASTMGYGSVCAFTHVPGYFVQLGFSIVPHAWVPQKIQTDCRTCPQFRFCDQYAVVLPLGTARDTWVPLANLHG